MFAFAKLYTTRNPDNSVLFQISYSLIYRHIHFNINSTGYAQFLLTLSIYFICSSLGNIFMHLYHLSKANRNFVPGSACKTIFILPSRLCQHIYISSCTYPAVFFPARSFLVKTSLPTQSPHQVNHNRVSSYL